MFLSALKIRSFLFCNVSFSSGRSADTMIQKSGLSERYAFSHFHKNFTQQTVFTRRVFPPIVVRQTSKWAFLIFHTSNVFIFISGENFATMFSVGMINISAFTSLKIPYQVSSCEGSESDTSKLVTEDRFFVSYRVAVQTARNSRVTDSTHTSTKMNIQTRQY